MKNQFKYQFCFLAVSMAFSAGATAQAAIDQSIERIAVTSDFRALSESEMPASTSIVTFEDIEQRQARFLSEILNSTANVNFNSGAGRGRYVQIRGIGERSQFKEPLNPSVGFFVDDLDFSGTMAIATLFDVAQVEVLKGPQGTTFGSSALAGVVKLKTADPDGLAGGKASVSLAEQNSLNLAVAYGDEISQKWQYRAAVQKYTSDGYIKNTYLDRDDTDNIDELSSRLKLRYLASDNLTFDFALHYYDIDNGYDAFSLDNVRQTISDEPGFDRQETTAFSSKITWEGEAYTFTGVYGTSDSDMEYGYDEDWTYVGFHPWEYSSTDHYFRTRDTDSVDLRLVSNKPLQLLGTDMDWVVGANLKKTDETLLRVYTYDVDFNSDYQLDNQAIYGEIYPKLTDDLTLTVGLRFEKASLDYADSDGFIDEESESFVGGRLVLDYQMTERMMSYISINRGYKLGGFNTDPRVPEALKYYNGEQNWNYEIGAKQYSADGDIYLGMAFFYMDRRETHYSSFLTETIADTGATSFIDLIVNADIGTNYGIEVESRYQVTPALEIFTNIGLLEATYDGFVNGVGEVDDKEQAQAPNYMFNAGINYALAESWMLSIEADAKSNYLFSDGHDVKSNNRILWHFNLNKSWDDVTFSLWGKNIFDKDYTVRGFGGFSNDPRDFYETPEPYVQFGDGRQVGMTIDYQF